MKTNSLTIIIYLLVTLPLITNAQDLSLVWKSNIFFSDPVEEIIEIHESSDFTQFYVVLDQGDFTMLAYSYDNENWSKLEKNTHNEEIEISQLIFAPKNSNKLYFKTKGEVTFQVGYQYLKSFEIDTKTMSFRSDDCDSPVIVPQSVWRAGLQDPVPGRTSSKTNHLVIHHSAGQTFEDNYADVVRAYYLYHINGNGWDDIGYNYLIDPDGVVYAGRDPLDSGASQDNVVGAHLCAKNRNTMGICVIGDYTDIFPSNTAISQLVNLLAWKVVKDTLEVFGEANHPLPNGASLPKIAGHRDGCATSCPGDTFYPAIESEIKNRINDKVHNCMTGTSLLPDFIDKTMMISPNPFDDYIDIEFDYINSQFSYNLYDVDGKRIMSKQPILSKRIELEGLKPGVYFIEIVTPSSAKTIKLIKK